MAQARSRFEVRDGGRTVVAWIAEGRARVTRSLRWMIAWCRSVRTTFEVVRLLDRESQLVPATAAARTRQPFVARTGYVI